MAEALLCGHPIFHVHWLLRRPESQRLLGFPAGKLKSPHRGLARRDGGALLCLGGLMKALIPGFICSHLLTDPSPPSSDWWSDAPLPPLCSGPPWQCSSHVTLHLPLMAPWQFPGVAFISFTKQFMNWIKINEMQINSRLSPSFSNYIFSPLNLL